MDINCKNFQGESVSHATRVAAVVRTFIVLNQGNSSLIRVLRSCFLDFQFISTMAGQNLSSKRGPPLFFILSTHKFCYYSGQLKFIIPKKTPWFFAGATSNTVPFRIVQQSRVTDFPDGAEIGLLSWVTLALASRVSQYRLKFCRILNFQHAKMHLEHP